MKYHIYCRRSETIGSGANNLSAAKMHYFIQVLFAGAVAFLMTFCLSACAPSNNSDENSSTNTETENNTSNNEEENKLAQAENFTVAFSYPSEDLMNASLALLEDKFESRKADFLNAGIDMDATEIGLNSIATSKSSKTSLPIYSVGFSVKFWDADGNRVFLYQDEKGVFKSTPYLTNFDNEVIQTKTKRGDANENLNVNIADISFDKDRADAGDYSSGELFLTVPICSGTKAGCSSGDFYWVMPDTFKGVEPAVTQALKEVLCGVDNLSFENNIKHKSYTFESFGADPNLSSGGISSFQAVDADSKGNGLDNGYELTVGMRYRDFNGNTTTMGCPSFNVLVTIAQDGTVTVKEVS